MIPPTRRTPGLLPSRPRSGRKSMNPQALPLERKSAVWGWVVLAGAALIALCQRPRLRRRLERRQPSGRGRSAGGLPHLEHRPIHLCPAQRRRSRRPARTRAVTTPLAMTVHATNSSSTAVITPTNRLCHRCGWRPSTPAFNSAPVGPPALTPVLSATSSPSPRPAWPMWSRSGAFGGWVGRCACRIRGRCCWPAALPWRPSPCPMSATSTTIFSYWESSPRLWWKWRG